MYLSESIYLYYIHICFLLFSFMFDEIIFSWNHILFYLISPKIHIRRQTERLIPKDMFSMVLISKHLLWFVFFQECSLVTNKMFAHCFVLCDPIKCIAYILVFLVEQAKVSLLPFVISFICAILIFFFQWWLNRYKPWSRIRSRDFFLEALVLASDRLQTLWKILFCSAYYITDISNYERNVPLNLLNVKHRHGT